MKDVSLAVVDSFWDSYSNLPKAQQKKTREFLTKFRKAPTSNAINYEKLNQACQDNYRSVRIDLTYRAIILVSKKDNVFLLLWVDHHDDCIKWAARTRVEVHPVTGSIQIFDVDYSAPQVPAADSAAASAPGDTTPQTGRLPEPIFNLDDTRLLGIGCPASMLEKVMDLRSRSELVSIEDFLPVETYEALMLFHEGVSWDEIWSEYHVKPAKPVDVEDIASALDRESSQRRFRVLESEQELQEMLNAPLEKWRVYLHPSQRKLVERDWNGPVRVLGGAGTGKTVVAMHRAAWLIRNRGSAADSARYLFLTYNTNLAQDIKQNLAKLMNADEMRQIEVINIDAWVRQFLNSNRYTSRMVGEGEMDRVWEDVLGAIKPSELNLPDSFYKEEWMRVIVPNRVLSRQDYFSANRQGRGVALSRKQRSIIWPVFDEVRSEMQSKGWKTFQDAALDAAQLLEELKNPPRYASVIVDEVQDMGSEALRLIRNLAEKGENDLFLVGDGHQRIYRSRAVMGQCGIEIRGRGKKLKINYRTTEQIRQFAVALLQDMTIDDLDGEDDQRNQYISLTSGNEPELDGFSNEEEEARFIADKIKSYSGDDRSKHGEICVVLRTVKLRDRYALLLSELGLAVVTLGTQANNPSVPGVRVANMHRVKGLEFRHMFMAAMKDGVVPNYYATTGTADKIEERDMELNERALIHVSASRAIETLNITWNGKPSPYLDKYES